MTEGYALEAITVGKRASYDNVSRSAFGVAIRLRQLRTLSPIARDRT